LFLGFGYKINVRFSFRSRRSQSGMQVSSAILFRVSLYNRLIIEKTLSQITNMEHIFSAKSLKRRQLPGCSTGCGPVTLQLFRNCFPRISRMPSRVWCCNASLNKNSFGVDITCNLTRHWFAIVIGEEIPFLPVRIELSVYL